ncbi:MAG: ATP-binding protein [Opitutales bacterium]
MSAKPLAKLSIFHKMLLAPGAALFLFLLFSFYIFNEQQGSIDELEGLRESFIPITEKAGLHVLLFEEVVGTFQDTVEAGEPAWLAEAEQQKKAFLLSLSQLEALDPSRLGSRLGVVEDSFLAYFESASRLSNALISGGEIDDRVFVEIVPQMENTVEATRQLLQEFRDAEQAAFDQAVRTINDRQTRVLLQGAGIGLLLFVVVIYIATTISLSTRRSIVQILESIQQLSSGKPDFSQRLEAQTEDELGTLVSRFNTFTDVLEKDYRSLEKAKGTIENALQRIQERSEKIATLLDNSTDGFLSFCRNEKIEAEYSQACERMLGKGFADKPISEAIFEEASDSSAFRDSLELVFSETNPVNREMMIELLPNSVSRAGLSLNLEYRYLDNETIMLIIGDLTEQVRLEKEIASERDQLKMVVYALKDQADLRELLADYIQFSIMGLAIDEDEFEKTNILDDLYRKIHTFKGLFGQFYFKDTAEKLHQLESEIDKWKFYNLPLVEIQEKLNNLRIEQYTQADLDVLRSVLHYDILTDSGSTNRDTEIAEVCRLIELAPEFPGKDSLLQQLRPSTQAPLSELILSSARGLELFAKKLGKQINSVRCTGEDMLVDADAYREWAKTLIHVFRNAVDHGIEEADTRQDLGKGARGNVLVRLSKASECIQVEITDDGAGVDLSRIEDLALEQNIISQAEVGSVSEGRLLSVLLHPAFSSRNSVNGHSGRGYGLSAVKECTEKLGGELKITSKWEEGTCFLFTLPRTVAKEG